MIHVLARIELATGTLSQYLEQFQLVAPLVREEVGCIEYDVAVDEFTTLSAQERIGENTVMVVEKWESLQALQAHLQAAHMNDYRSKTKEYVKSVKLAILKPASS